MSGDSPKSRSNADRTSGHRGPPRLSSSPANARVLGDPHYAMTITTRCQQRCAFCFEGDHGSGQDSPLEQVKAHLEEAAGKVPYVVFMGAESSLHRRFLDALTLTREARLLAAISSNLLRFADESFLRACVDRGLRAFEFSFHYPDAESFAKLTRTRSDGFARLLRAMENVGRLCHERNLVGCPADIKTAVPGGPCACYHVGPNVVISTLNVLRLPEVLRHVAQHLGPAFNQVTFKRLMVQRLGRDQVDAAWVPSGNQVRAALTDLLDDWPYPGATALIRDFPMCIAPGYEHLFADLLYHARQAVVLQNFGRLTTYQAMYEYEELFAGRLPEACGGCRIAGLCRVATRGATLGACVALDAIPCRREPLEVLLDLGVEPGDAAAFLERLAGGQGGAPEPGHRTSIVEKRAAELIRRSLAANHLDDTASLQRVRQFPEQRRLKIAVTIDGQPLELIVERAAAGEPCYAAGKRFSIAHAAWCSLPPSSDRVIRLILTMLDRHL
jgi:hypothetical protein